TIHWHPRRRGHSRPPANCHSIPTRSAAAFPQRLRPNRWQQRWPEQSRSWRTWWYLLFEIITPAWCAETLGRRYQGKCEVIHNRKLFSEIADALRHGGKEWC